uniref:Myb/SANT-like domain-containing protein n=1 Tax=Chenopodium quinoa TaxID=63459 RepID=A0A803MGA7_CHEQI
MLHARCSLSHLQALNARCSLSLSSSSSACSLSHLHRREDLLSQVTGVEGVVYALKSLLKDIADLLSCPASTYLSYMFFPWFEDFIGAIDGTHIRASVPIEMQGRFRGRKGGTTQNVLAAVDLRKYYLDDAGYGDRKGFMPPYRHAESFWPYETQVNVVLACCVLHNNLRGVDPNDPITREVEVEMASQDLQHMGEARTRRKEQEENQQIERKRKTIAMAMWTVVKEEKKTNFCWSKDMSKELLDFLAEEVKKGNRPNNTFRTSSFVAAAKIISEKFQTNCTSEHVENHMKTVRNAWVAISTVRNNSGFGWNDNLKMVIASPTTYATYVKFLNRKIDMYEEMAIVLGKDLARGNFSKTFADIDVDASMESGQPSMTNDSVPFKAESGTSLGSRPHRKRSRIDEGSEMEHISAQLQEVFALAVFKVTALVAICCLVLVHSALPFVSCFLLLFCYNSYAATWCLCCCFRLLEAASPAP